VVAVSVLAQQKQSLSSSSSSYRFVIFGCIFLNSISCLLIRAPLGSIPELPVHSRQEIKASRGTHTDSSTYSLDPTTNGTLNISPAATTVVSSVAVFAGGGDYHYCDLNVNCTDTAGRHNCTCKGGFARDWSLVFTSAVFSNKPFENGCSNFI